MFQLTSTNLQHYVNKNHPCKSSALKLWHNNMTQYQKIFLRIKRWRTGWGIRNTETCILFIHSRTKRAKKLGQLEQRENYYGKNLYFLGCSRFDCKKRIRYQTMKRSLTAIWCIPQARMHWFWASSVSKKVTSGTTFSVIMYINASLCKNLSKWKIYQNNLAHIIFTVRLWKKLTR